MAVFEYTRVYADDEGDTHVEDVRVPMSLVDFAPSAAPVILDGHGAVTASDGERRSGNPRMRFLLEDTTGKGHSSKFFDDVTALVIRLTQDVRP